MQFTHTLPKINISNAVNLPEICSGEYSLLQNLSRDGHMVYGAKSGRDALCKVLTYLKKSAQVALKVEIRTSSGNNYVSSCVTDVIKSFFDYSINEYESNADIVLIIHEFGYLAPLEIYESSNKTIIIEDFAYSMATYLTYTKSRRLPDYRVFSFSKFLPFQGGGALTSTLKLPLKFMKEDLLLLKTQVDLWAQTQIENVQFLDRNIDISEGIYFSGYEGVPEVAVLNFRLNAEKLEKLKRYLNATGIECTIYYGQQAFILPIGHSLTHNQKKYIIERTNEFAKQL